MHVAFDIGNVLVNFDIFAFTTELSKATGLSDNEAYFFLESIQAMQDIGVTSVSQTLKSRFDLADHTNNALLDAWNSTISESQVMMNFLDQLRFEGTKIALLSNMGPEHLIHLRANYPKIFQDSVQHISCEVGARKPHKLFFQSFCHDWDEFTGCLYIDDVEANLKAGKRYGFETYQFNLSEFSKLPASKQKIELDQLTKRINNR